MVICQPRIPYSPTHSTQCWWCRSKRITPAHKLHFIQFLTLGFHIRWSTSNAEPHQLSDYPVSARDFDLHHSFLVAFPSMSSFWLCIHLILLISSKLCYFPFHANPKQLRSRNLDVPVKNHNIRAFLCALCRSCTLNLVV